MPIDPERQKLYPGGSLRSPEWLAIRQAILARAHHACEGAPEHYPDCRAPNSAPHPETGSRVVLTIAHLDHDPTNNDPANLRALCQRCHNTHDSAHRRANARARLRKARALGDLFAGGEAAAQ